jgi:hypothetical protein
METAYSAFDPVLYAWASANGLDVAITHRDDAVRSITVVDAAGRPFQIWLEVASGRASVRASSNQGRQSRNWASNAVSAEGLAAMLDAALQEVRRWGAAP